MSRSKIALKLTVITASVFFITVLTRALLLQNVFYTPKSSPAPGRPPTVKLTRSHISAPMRLPYRGITRSVEEILKAPWIIKIQRYLMTLESGHVSLCIADSRYMEAVVNWLVSALVNIKPPLENVLVISLDLQLYQFLQKRGLESVFMDPDTILIKNVNFPSNFSHIWVTRVVLFRLLNHWGYTVATYDSDAVLIHNPQPLFAELGSSDLIGSPGTYPFDLHRQWKTPTLCMGMALFRASERTEIFWNHLSDVQLSLEKYDDQVVVNNALDQCGITWRLHQPYVVGRCQQQNLSVVLLPTSAVCRKCKEKGAYYVRHQKGARGQEDKRRIAGEGGVWFLKQGQDLNAGELKGIDWLRYLYYEQLLKSSRM